MFENLTNWQIFIIIIVIIVIVYFIYNWNSYSYFTPEIRSNNSKKMMQMASPTSNNRMEVPFILYNFYSPSCGYSQQFMPSWNAVADKLKNVDAVSVKAINAASPGNENLTFYYNIKGYPTVILVTPDRNVEYAGDRSPDDLYNFVMKYVKDYYSKN